jgi:hypothetical protein
MNYVWKLRLPVLCCLLLAAAGCGSPATNNGNGSPAANQNAGSAASPGAPVAASRNPLDSMSNAMRAQLNAKSFRARMESSFAGENSTRVVEFVAPDRFHMTSDIDEIIIVGPSTYRRTKNGQWQKFPLDAGSMVSTFRDPKMIDELAKSTEMKFLGSEVLDGTPTFVYQYTMTNAYGSGMTTQSKTWIGAADSLPRKSEVEAEINKEKSKTTITYYDYNTNIQIEPPIYHERGLTRARFNTIPIYFGFGRAGLPAARRRRII